MLDRRHGLVLLLLRMSAKSECTNIKYYWKLLLQRSAFISPLRLCCGESKPKSTFSCYDWLGGLEIELKPTWDQDGKLSFLLSTTFYTEFDKHLWLSLFLSTFIYLNLSTKSDANKCLFLFVKTFKLNSFVYVFVQILETNIRNLNNFSFGCILLQSFA